MVSERRWLVLIFSLYLLLGVGYSLLMPIWEAPDEPAHYHLAWSFARKGKFPGEEKNYETVQPHTYYFLSAYAIRSLEKINPLFTNYYFPREIRQNIRVPEPRFEWNDSNYRFMLGVYALRWINLMIGAFALWLNWKAGCLIVPDSSTLRLSALALAALTPQYLHIMSSVSNDAMGTLAGAVLLYLALRMMKEDLVLIAILSMIAAIVLPLTSKLTVLPVSAGLLTLLAGKWSFGLRQRRWFVLAGILLLLAAVVLYVFFPDSLRGAASEVTWRLFSFRKRGLTPDYLILVSNQILQTYWGRVGWIAVGLPDWIIYLLTISGFGGMILQARRLLRQKSEHPEFSSWVATFVIALFTLLAVARNGLTTGATQGRFLFPAIGALSLLMIGGWHGVLPEKFQRRLPLIVILLMITLNLGLWIFGIIPVYYQPFLD